MSKIEKADRSNEARENEISEDGDVVVVMW
jgi:hypothetical protein